MDIQLCSACKIQLPQADYSPSRWGLSGAACRSCLRKRAADSRRAKGIPERKTGFDKAAHNKQWKLDNPDWQRNSDLQRLYGISLEDYTTLLTKQGGVCKVCKNPETHTYKGVVRHLHVDHSHETGRVRGLLCARCNFALGHAREDISILESLISYLKESQ